MSRCSQGRLWARRYKEAEKSTATSEEARAKLGCWEESRVLCLPPAHATTKGGHTTPLAPPRPRSYPHPIRGTSPPPPGGGRQGDKGNLLLDSPPFPTPPITAGCRGSNKALAEFVSVPYHFLLIKESLEPRLVAGLGSSKVYAEKFTRHPDSAHPLGPIFIRFCFLLSVLLFFCKYKETGTHS